MIDPLARVPRDPISFQAGSVVVLCEGNDECAVVQAIAKELSLDIRSGIAVARLADEMRGLGVQVKLRDLRAVGLVFDREDGIEETEFHEAWPLLFEGIGVRVPTVVEGVAVHPSSGKSLKVGAFLCPGPGSTTGSLETLLRKQVDASALKGCIDQFIGCHENTGSTQAQIDKQVVRTYLAAKNAVNTTINVGIQKAHLFLGPEFDGLRSFLQELTD